MVLPRQLVGRGSPPTSPVALLLAFRNGAPSGSLLRVFALSLRDGVTLPGRVCLSPRSDRRLLLHLPGVCALSLRDGVTLSGRDLFQISIETKICWRTFPCGWCLAFASEGFFHSSILSCFAMGSPSGSRVWFPALDRNEAVFG